MGIVLIVIVTMAAMIAALGFAGKDVGRILEALLEQASDGALPNEREALLEAAVKAEKH